MLKDITLGQYYPADSILHRLDPRVKVVGTLIFIVCVFLVRGVTGYAFLAVSLFSLILLSRVPVRYVLRGMRAILFILCITVIFNLFLTPGEILWRWWIFKITREGVRQAARMALRLAFLVMGSQLMTLTTTPNALTNGMERLFAPLKLLRVPVHEIAMMMSIALRFIPILMEETNKIMEAQMARGADFESGNIIRRVKNMIPLLVPLFVSAFKRAGDLALAMEARCYHGGEGRTQMRPLRCGMRDYIAYAVIFLFLAGCIAIRVFSGRLI